MAVGNKKLIAGIDVGSTTTKIVVLDAETKETVYSDYRRHHASQLKSVLSALKEFSQKFPGQEFSLAMTGSGSKPIAEKLGLPFVQEVVANSIALCFDYQNVGTAIELGGQDAKMIFFGKEDGRLKVNDMRMNGSCAGGTGAFIDEVASILKVSVQEINSLAEKGSCVYDISGRCGVYAKTDIQPLLNQGISKADLALSAFHAIAKQTIGGLAQGLDIKSPVVFEGGPLTFNPVLIRVFAERLNLEPKDILNPPHPE
ncbi:MAG: activase, partial [Treponema sp.]|nr:activase [Treponema sp.]